MCSGNNDGSSGESNSGTTSQSNLSLIISQSLGIAAQNAVVAQQMGNVLHSAVAAVGVDALLSQTTTSPKSLNQVLQEMQKAIDGLKNNGDSEQESTPDQTTV